MWLDSPRAHRRDMGCTLTKEEIPLAEQQQGLRKKKKTEMMKGLKRQQAESTGLQALAL